MVLTVRMLSSCTITSLIIESTSDRPVRVSTSVTSESHRADSDGVRNGTGDHDSLAALDRGKPAHHLDVFENLGPPISKARLVACGAPRTATR